MKKACKPKFPAIQFVIYYPPNMTEKMKEEYLKNILDFLNEKYCKNIKINGCKI